jgi:hypothetical protein
MKKKVRKFASGGDILTAAGAVLLGKHLYDKYKEGKGKDDEDSDYARKVREFNKKEAEATAVEPKAEPKTESREEYLEKRGAKPLQETGTRANPYYKEDEPAPKKSVVTTTPKKAAPAAKKTTPAAPAAKKAEPAPKSVVFKPAEDSKKAESPVSKKAESPVKLGSPGSYKFDSKPDLSTPKGFDLKGTNKTAYGTDTTSVFQKKAAQERAEAEEKAKKKAKEQANIRSGESERMMRESLGSGFKRGGAVKKYASGGSVSSASKRADGIAQRGKTRGRVL